MSAVQFDDLRWLHLLWIVLLVVLAGIYGQWQRRRCLRAFAQAGLLERLTAPRGWLRAMVRLTLVTLCLLLLTAAIIGPRWGQVEQTVTRRGIDVMVVLDVSRSMLARDIAPNRLERAKVSIRDDLLPALGGDRIGLITFAGVATLKCPLTHDYGFFRLALEDVSTASSPRGGTLIGDALRKAAECLDDQLDTYKIVLLITDGEDHESFPVEAAKALWQDLRVPVVAVALGDEREGAQIPLDGDQGRQYLTYNGEVVWTRANFDALRQIAAVSELGLFVPVGTRNFDLGEVYRQRIVPAIEYRELSEEQQVLRPARYQWFALAALALLLWDSLLKDGPRRRDTLRLRRDQEMAA